MVPEDIFIVSHHTNAFIQMHEYKFINFHSNMLLSAVGEVGWF